MDRLDRAAERLAQALALVGALGVVALLVHVAADVALRNLLARPIPATNEIVSRYYMVAMAFLPLAWVERRGGMVRVELIDAALSPGLKRLSELAVAALTLAIYLTLAWVSSEHALKQWNVGAFVDVLGRRVIVWPTFFLPAAGFFLAALVVAQRILALLSGRSLP